LFRFAMIGLTGRSARGLFLEEIGLLTGAW
jgi:hypothetical protein